MPRPPIALRSKLAPLLVRPHRSPPAGAPSAWPARPHRTACLHAPRPRRPPGPPARLHRSPTRAPAPPSAPSALCRLPTPAPARHGPPARPPAPLASTRPGPAVRLARPPACTARLLAPRSHCPPRPLCAACRALAQKHTILLQQIHSALTCTLYFIAIMLCT